MIPTRWKKLTDDPVVIDQVKRLVHIAPLEKVFNLAPGTFSVAVWFRLACCAIEGLMAANMARFDLSRFGYEVNAWITPPGGCYAGVWYCNPQGCSLCGASVRADG